MEEEVPKDIKENNSILIEYNNNMEINNNINNNINIDNIIKDNENKIFKKSFGRLCNLQKIINKECAKKELCKIFY